MATAQTEYQKFMSRNALRLYDFDPGATTETEIAWVDMRDYEGFIATFFRTIGTGAVTFKIMANTASDGSGTDADISTHAVGSEPDAVGDQIHLEISSEMLATSSTAGLRYVTAVVSVATGTDEGVVSYVRYNTRNAKDALTADIVA